MEIRTNGALSRDQAARLVLVATMGKLQKQAKAAVKRHDWTALARIGDELRTLQAAALEG